MIMDASINVTMEPFRALVGDMLPDEQHTKDSLSRRSLSGAVVGSLLPSIMNNFFGLSNTAPGEVPDNESSFYVGAAILFSCVMWISSRPKNIRPSGAGSFLQSNNRRPGKKKNGFLEIMHDIRHAQGNGAAQDVQFFSWFALFSMWVYTTPAFGATCVMA